MNVNWKGTEKRSSEYLSCVWIVDKIFQFVIRKNTFSQTNSSLDELLCEHELFMTKPNHASKLLISYDNG